MPGNDRLSVQGDPIRVAMLHGPGRPDRDGVSDYVVHLMAALREVGVEPVPVPVRPDGERAPWRWLTATRRAAEQVRRLGPDLVHVQFAPSAYRFSGLPGLLPLRLPRAVPLVTTVHEYGWWAVPRWLPEAVWAPLERIRLWDRETGRLVPTSAAVIVTNPAHAAAVHRRAGAPPVQVPLAPNVHDHGAAPDARRRVRERLGLPPAAPLLVFFGFVHPVKGVRQLIEALPALRARRPYLHLLVVGGFTSQALPEPEARAFHAELVDLTHRHRVADAVTFTGHVPPARVSAALHAADVVVLPFTAGVTCKSGALLAALAHGVPVAATRAEEPDDQLRDGETVALIPRCRDAPAIVDTVGRVLDDADLRRRLADGGRALAKRHSWPRIAAAHRRIYDHVLGRVDG